MNAVELEQEMRSRILHSKLSYREIGKRCGVSVATISRFVTAGQSIYLSTLERLSREFPFHVIWTKEI